jgi:AraC-like DNA-binding protein
VTAAQGAYGERLGRWAHVDAPPALVTRSLRRSQIAVTELRHEAPPLGVVTDPIPAEDAFLVALQLRAYPHHQHWEAGKGVSAVYGAGHTTLYDLKRSPSFEFVAPFHSVHFYLPRAVLDDTADDMGAPRVNELRYVAGVSHDDPTMSALGRSLLPAFERPDEASQVFLDHVNMAVAAHVLLTYGGLPRAPQPARGGLAPWQEKRAKDLLCANLTQDVSLQAVAQACGLSLSHFSRAFRQTTGRAPYAWLLRRRIDAAKDLLRAGRLSLAEIGLACGFADQSHFTRVFSRHAGVGPGAWRRGVLT